MTDASNFVFRWEITTVAIANGKISSEVWNAGGFKWVVTMERTPNCYTDMRVNCSVDHNGPWKCEAEVKFAYRSANEGANLLPIAQKVCNFDNLSASSTLKGLSWSHFTNKIFDDSCRMNMEINIKIISSSERDDDVPSLPNPASLDLSKFISPVETSNVTLVIGEKKLIVSKEYLAMHSPVFTTMFFGDENGKKEVEIKEVAYEEVVSLLLAIFPDPVKINDDTVLPIAKLADRFQIKGVQQSAEQHVLTSNRFSIEDKMQIADDYRFEELRDHCLQSYKSARELKVKNNDQFDNYSDKMKMAISKRLMQLL